MRWFTPLFTSEISFFFHLPFFLHLKTPNNYIQTSLFVIRNILNTAIFTLLFQHAVWYHPYTFITAMTESHYTVEVLSLFIISLILWLFSNAHVRHYSHDDELPFNTLWYYISHASIINFFLDVPSIGMPTTTIPFALSIILNVIIIIGLIKFIFIDEVLNNAWGTYNPLYYPNITTYIYGVRPTGHDASNSPFWTKHMIRDLPGRDNISDLDEYVHSTIILLFVKLVIYIIAIPAEVSYYLLHK
jgi:hypothetical protein